MDIEKLIERVYKHHTDWGEGRTQDFFEVCLDCKDAATALSTLQAENEKLLDENRRWSEATKTLSCAIENLRAELEQAKAERDAAVESIPHECKTCVYHTVFFNGCTLDHDCTNPDGGCSNNNDRWKWRGQKEE